MPHKNWWFCKTSKHNRGDGLGRDRIFDHFAIHPELEETVHTAHVEDHNRHLTIRVEGLEEGPSSGMLAKQARERRDAKWGRRDDGDTGYSEEGAAS